MVEPIITSGAALVGASAWFLNKLLGPSADAMGDQIKLYGTSRLKSIFQKAEEEAAPEKLQAIPPGFAVQFLQKASVSEDEENLTEMWARLLVSASQNFSSRHSVFADILSQINSFDAKQLDELVPHDTYGGPETQMSVNQKSSLRQKIQLDFVWPAKNADEARANFHAMTNFDLAWPGRITSGTFPYMMDAKIGMLAGGSSDWFSSYDVMFRQGLIDKFAFDLGTPMNSPYIEGFLVTALGVRFTQTCRGLA